MGRRFNSDQWLQRWTNGGGEPLQHFELVVMLCWRKPGRFSTGGVTQREQCQRHGSCWLSTDSAQSIASWLSFLNASISDSLSGAMGEERVDSGVVVPSRLPKAGFDIAGSLAVVFEELVT